MSNEIKLKDGNDIYNVFIKLEAVVEKGKGMDSHDLSQLYERLTKDHTNYFDIHGDYKNPK